MATKLFQYFCRFDVDDQVNSHPWSDLMSEILILLNKWFGIKKLVSLLDWHESDDAELTANNYQLSVSALLHNEIISQSSSDLTIFHLCEHFLTSATHSHTSLSKIRLFRSSYSRLPPSSTSLSSSLFIQQLNTNIQNVLRTVFHSYQQYLHADHSVTFLPQNSFQNSDLVLF